MDPVPSNLPAQLTSFIGRERELLEAKNLLSGHRLLTLTGAGGSGKTRLAIELSARSAPEFPDGISFVPLAQLRDPDLVASSIAQTLGVRTAGHPSVIDRLVSYLQERRVLLVLDNFEHVADAASVVVDLLGATRAVRVLVTSRSPLHVSGEQEYPVPPLQVPGGEAPRSLVGVTECESVRLFVDRASAILPGFVIDATKVDAISQIVRRVDGLPLAIELAAARIKVLSPEAILARLQQSSTLLVGRAPKVPDRQRTLRATVAWSYQLLSAGAQHLLADCSVFRGGASLEAIELVCQPAVAAPVLDSLDDLVDHSLLRRDPRRAEVRYSMLEVIREFAAERLAELPQAAAVQQRHAEHFSALAAAAGPYLTGPREREWLERLDLEHDNIRAAIEWHRQTSPANALAVAATMSAFWARRGHFSEGRQRLDSLLDAVPDETATRVRAVNGAAWLAIDQGDYAHATDLLTRAIELSRKLDDLAGEGSALLYLGRAKIASGRAADASDDIEHATKLLRAANDQPGVALAMLYTGLAAQFTDRLEAACRAYETSVAMCSLHSYRWIGARASQMLGMTQIELGDLAGARAALAEGLPTSLELGDRWMMAIGLAGFAGLAARSGQPRAALRLAGAALAYSESNEYFMSKPVEAMLDRWIAPVREQLGHGAQSVDAEGRHMTLQEAVAAALADEAAGGSRGDSGPRLTPRELEVATMAARGLSNRDIAGELYLSVRTVDAHVDHILTKLGFHSRTQLAGWAYQSGIVSTTEK